MIIKFEVNGAWQIYDDVDSLMYRRMGLFDQCEYNEPAEGIKEEEISGDLIDYTETLSTGEGDPRENSDSKGHPGRVLLTFMNSKQTANSQVVAYSPIYLMNNNGRTIETI
jgi:hypothetical protein